jgi:hypothetical protein
MAAVNAPQSRRFAQFKVAWQSRQRLDCGRWSTALEGRGNYFRAMTRMGTMMASHGKRQRPFLTGCNNFVCPAEIR